MPAPGDTEVPPLGCPRHGLGGEDRTEFPCTERPGCLEPKGGWPCDKRVAHGPHEECPGVDAHPGTSIGGRHDGKPAMYGQIDLGPLTGGV